MKFLDTEGVRQLKELNDAAYVGKEEYNDDTMVISAALNDLNSRIEDKQDALTFDSTPTSESTNAVTSGGVYTELNNKISSTRFDVVEGLTKSQYDALATKDDRTIYIVDDPNGEISQPISIQSVTQTTESTVSGGTNVITVTKTDGTTSTFNVRNGDAVGSATIVQTTGDSTTSVMSQDGATKAIAAGAQSVKTGTSIIFPNRSVTKLSATQVAAINAAEEITIKWVMKASSLNMMYRYTETCGLPPYYLLNWSYFQTLSIKSNIDPNSNYLGKYVNGSTAASNTNWSNQCVVINRVTGRVRWYQNTTLVVDETSDDYKADKFISDDGYLFIATGDYETRFYALQIYDYDVTQFWSMDSNSYAFDWISGNGDNLVTPDRKKQTIKICSEVFV